jgi:hypothetical protein
MTTQVKRGTFSPEMFGEDLAAILDGLLRVQQMDAAEMANAPVPLLSPFATPTGTSWYEADMLTRHYHMIGNLFILALQKDPELGALLAEKRSADGTVVERPVLYMIDVRRMRYERYLRAQNAAMME